MSYFAYYPYLNSIEVLADLIRGGAQGREVRVTIAFRHVLVRVRR